MFNNKYKPYQQVPHYDSADEIELHDVSPHTESNNKITNLLKLTAHRRIRQHNEYNEYNEHIDNNTTDSIIHINDNDSDNEHPHTNTESTHLIHSHTTSNDLDDIDLNDAHADSQSEQGEQSATDDDAFDCDDYVLLLFLDGNKKRVGIMKTWRIWNLKDKYFKQELQNGCNVRLIYRGKLLQDALLMNEYNIPTDGFIHVSISKNGYKQTYGNDMNNNLENDDINYENFDDGMDDEAMARMLQQREMGIFSGNNGNNNGGGMGNEEQVDAYRARREFLCGMFLGSVAGIWILIFLILAQRRSYSRRFRLGVTLGVAINLMIQISYQYPNINGGGDADDQGNSTETEQSDVHSQDAVDT